MKAWICIAAILFNGVISGALSYKLGWKEGWSAACIDSQAIRGYHADADRLQDDEDPKALAAIWAEQIKFAKATESNWNAIGCWRKLRYPMAPFWKANNGEPRRLSKGQKEKLVEGLKAIREKDNP